MWKTQRLKIQNTNKIIQSRIVFGNIQKCTNENNLLQQQKKNMSHALFLAKFDQFQIHRHKYVHHQL